MFDRDFEQFLTNGAESMSESIIGHIPLNPGIKRTVGWLNEHGFKTVDSGDGETHACECDRPNAYVVILVEDHDQLIAETDRLVGLLEDKGIKIEAQSEDDDHPYIQSSYDPADRTALIDLNNVKDTMLFPVPLPRSMLS